jgi:hypothetical protein
MTMPRYKLRTLLLFLAVGPPLIWFVYQRWESARSPKPPQRGPIIHTAKFLGNRRFSDVKLRRTLDLRQSEPTFLNPRWCDAARLKIIALYRQAGHREVEVTLVEGGKAGDVNAVFRIEEGAIVAPSRDRNFDMWRNHLPQLY